MTEGGEGTVARRATATGGRLNRRPACGGYREGRPTVARHTHVMVGGYHGGKALHRMGLLSIYGKMAFSDDHA
jgi:hypothetical protein